MQLLQLHVPLMGLRGVHRLPAGAHVLEGGPCFSTQNLPQNALGFLEGLQDSDRVARALLLGRLLLGRLLLGRLLLGRLLLGRLLLGRLLLGRLLLGRLLLRGP